jgi:hypothetical protein
VVVRRPLVEESLTEQQPDPMVHQPVRLRIMGARLPGCGAVNGWNSFGPDASSTPSRVTSGRTSQPWNAPAKFLSKGILTLSKGILTAGARAPESV